MNGPESSPPTSEGERPKMVAKKSPRRIGIRLFICLAACGGLLAWLIGAISDAREAARCNQCSNNLKQLGIGLDCFENANGGLPPAYLRDGNGKPIHSWQSLVKPFLGYYSWRRDYSMKESWDGPNNQKLQTRPDDVFRCPSVGRDEKSRVTIDYVAVVGPDTMWPGRERVQLPPKGIGNQDTILLIEMPDSDYGCLEPRSPTLEEFLEKIRTPTGKGIRCIHRKGLAYVTVGGDVRWFPPDTDLETIRRLFKRDPNCKVVSLEEMTPFIERWGVDEDDSK
jgi:hypothetical protein